MPSLPASGNGKASALPLPRGDAGGLGPKEGFERVGPEGRIHGDCPHTPPAEQRLPARRRVCPTVAGGPRSHRRKTPAPTTPPTPKGSHPSRPCPVRAADRSPGQRSGHASPNPEQALQGRPKTAQGNALGTHPPIPNKPCKGATSAQPGGVSPGDKARPRPKAPPGATLRA